MFIGKHILFRKRDKSKEASVKVSTRVQNAYKNMCKKLKLRYKFLADAPTTFRVEDDSSVTWDDITRPDLGEKAEKV